MKINKYDKDILNNKNLDAPTDNVLHKAKSILPQKKQVAKFNSKQVIAFVSACAVILVVIICIPFMMPANNDLPFVKNTDLEIKELESIDIYNKSENKQLLCFDTCEASYQYIYCGKTVFIEEVSYQNDAKITLLVEFVENTVGYVFEKQNEYLDFLNGTESCDIDNNVVYWFDNGNIIYLTFNHNDYNYYMKIDNNSLNWQELLKKILN